MRNSMHLSRTLSLAVALALGSARLQAAPAPGTLPTPCAPGTCNGGPSKFVTSGQASAITGGNKLTITQTSNNATLNWANFDVGSGASVIFKQPGASSVALNRIYQADPSQIFGTVQSNGQIYLINGNGFLFGNGSVVNVGGLIASSLNVSDATFSKGILNPGLLLNSQAAFVAGQNNDGTAGVANTQASVVVDAGATLSTTAANGRLLLVAPRVDNAGSLSAADGQVILASGQKLYLQASSDSNLRGLIVEVDAGGTTTNETTGNLSAARGNVTMLGLAVNQMGRVSATTSVASNGSIRLVAGDTLLSNQSPGATLQRTDGGTLTLGPGSVTTVTPDTSGGSAVDASLQQQSVLDLEGAKIFMNSGAQLVAPDASVLVQARVNPSNLAQGASDGSEIRIASGAVIDVAGSNDSVPVATNVVEAQLRANEFADSPQQRNGALRGKTVYVDVRQGTASNPGTTIANLSGQAGIIERDIYQRTSQGGTVTLDSAGDVVVAQGSTVNVSGGVVNYTPSWIQTSYLVTADGKLVPISEANAATTYIGIVNPTVSRSDDRWGTIQVAPNSALANYDPGYIQGSAAGTLNIVAPNMVVQGNLLGHSVTGVNQRAAGTTTPGGQLFIGAVPAAGTALDYRAPSIEITNSPVAITVEDGSSVPSNLSLQLPAAVLNQDGFTRVAMYSNGAITQDAATPITMPVGSSLSLNGATVNLHSSITLPSGALNVNSTQTVGSGDLSLANTGVFVDPNVALDVRGNWTNDGVLPQGDVPTSPIALNGGSIKLNQGVYGGTLSIGSGASLSVSGGAWQKQGGSLLGGSAGSISLNEGAGGTLIFGSDIGLDAYGVQGTTHGALGGGGTLSITAPRISISSGSAATAGTQTVSNDPTVGGTLNLNSSLFSNDGFSRINLSADGALLPGSGDSSTMSITPNTTLNLSALTYIFTQGARDSASAATVGSVLAPALAPSNLRTAESLSLSASTNPELLGATSAGLGALSVGSGAVINADPRSVLSFSSVNGINMDGAIHAPSGAVKFATTLALSEGLDSGYLPGLRIDMGPHAVLDVAGEAIYQPNTQGFLTGDLLPGGSVTFAAQRGSVTLEPGSLVNVSGASAPFDIQAPGSSVAPVRTTLGSAAGSVTVAAPEQISLVGTLQAQGGTGSALNAAGGTLSVTLSRVVGTGFSNGVGNTPASFDSTNTPRTIELLPNAPGVASTPQNGLGMAVLDPKVIESSGFGSLFLSADQIELAAGTQLAMPQAVTLQTPALLAPSSGSASVTAAYLSVGTGTALYPTVAPSAGDGSITLTGQQSVDLAGQISLKGATDTTIASGGFIQLVGNQRGSQSVGGLATAGNLTLAATEIYPSTATSYSISAQGSPFDTVTINQVGARPATPLSAAGSVSITADDIIQNGTIVAPFGSIALNAVAPQNPTANDGVLTLGAGSYTSVSGNGALIPYGLVNNGTTWVYSLDVAQAASATPTVITSVPTRQVSLSGSSVKMASGSVVDVSGGGDLYASSFTPGTGGTVDALANSAATGLYAILPSTRGQFGAFDPLLFSDSGLKPGASVYLAGGAGLAAGFYPLLPARDALLPGAYLVQAVPGFANLTPGTTAVALNGSPVVSGYFTFGSTGAGTNYSGFQVQPGSYSRQLANYGDNLASKFFTPSSGALPADAGTLAISTISSLNAAGTVIGSAATGGRNALIELSAPAIEIDPTLATNVAPGVVQLSAAELASWNPGRVLLGGLYTDINTIDVTATLVSVTAGSALSAGEVVIVANQAIDVASNAKIQSTSGVAGQALPVAVSTVPQTLSLTGNDAGSAALLAVSDYSAYIPSRSGASNLGEGTVTVNSGAVIGSRGAISLDVPGGATLASGVLSGNGANFALGGGQVVFGAADNAPGALVLDSSVLNAASGGSSLEITASGGVTITQALNLGNATGNKTLQSVTLTAPVITNAVPGTDSVISAQTINLSGSANNNTVAQAGSGTLTLNTSNLNVGPGVEVINGFSNTLINDSGLFKGVGDGAVVAAGDLSATASAFTAASGAKTQVAALGGVLTLSASGTAAPSRSTLSPGGSLTFAGQSLVDNASILLPAGDIALVSASTLSLGSSSVMDAAGKTGSTAGSPLAAPGGRITLQAAADLTQAVGSKLSVSGVAGSEAGVINVSSGGQVALDGSLLGNATAGTSGGSFNLVAQNLDNFAGLANTLQSGGFTQAQSIDVKTGNLDVGLGTVLTARSVTLVADSGSISVEGGIAASGTGSRGSITLDAGTGLTLANSAVLSANGLDANTRGGRIELSTTTGQVTIDPAATISAQGAGNSGQLLVRAPATSTDLSLTGLPTDVSHIGQVFIEPTQTFALSSGNPAAAEFTSAQTSVAAYIAANADSILARLGATLSSNVALSPLLDFTYSGGDLTLPALDFSAWRFNGVPATVAISATGNLNVSGTINDGFVTRTTITGTGPRKVTTTQTDLLSGPSSSLVLVAGADLSSASLVGVQRDVAADLTLNDGVVVRTGTGDIALAAAQDVVLGTFGGTGASVYTGGIPAAPTFNPLTVTPSSAKNMALFTTYPDQGGAVLIEAGRDIIGAPTRQTPAVWQPRTADLLPTGVVTPEWGVDPGKFGWSVGALGGGDVNLVAGRHLVDVSAATADSAVISNGALTYYGGGNLAVRTGQDVQSSEFYVARGTGDIRAFGSLGSDPNYGTSSVGTLLYAGATRYNIAAQGGVLLEGEVPLSALYTVSPTGSLLVPNLQDATQPPVKTSLANLAYFYRFAPDSALNVLSSGAGVEIREGAGSLATFIDDVTLVQPSTSFSVSLVAPTVNVGAFGGDVTFSGSAALFPSTNGNLNVYASRNLNLSNGSIVMLDTPSTLVNGVDNPTSGAFIDNVFGQGAVSGALHTGDRVPVTLIAGGNITGGSANAAIQMPKATQIYAGGDIADVGLILQNTNDNDVSVVQAAGNITYSTSAQNLSDAINGGGRADFIAGGSIDLGYSRGIASYGKILNGNLTTTSGAGLNVLAGVGQPLGVSTFLSKVVAPSESYQQELIAYVEQQNGQSGLTYTQAESEFQAFSTIDQRPLLLRLFFDALVQSGREANKKPSVGFTAGFDAINALFPGSNPSAGQVSPYAGNLGMGFSQVYTLAGGTINIVVPGGSVDVGLANPPGNLASLGLARPPSQLGIVAEGTGDVNIFTHSDVNVNASRIFTLGGGNIAVWSSYGNIDAGRGAKTSVSAPPPTVTVDASGQVSVNFGAAVAGSGIRTIQTEPGQNPGNVDLDAPNGIVNAGDAGIGSAGNLNVAAVGVAGLDNIQVGGTSSGVPPALSGIGAALAGATGAASSSSAAGTSMASSSTSQKEQAGQGLGAAALGWLDVFVTGLGDDSCKPDDLECLKRQKH